jgi:glycosyltransferase involved in cell wall biosynthesis
MKVLLISKYEKTGGAAIACHRLVKALYKAEVPVRMLVQESSPVPAPFVLSTSNTKLKKLINFYRFVYERLTFLRQERSRQVRFMFSPANTGEDISNHPALKDSEIIHLHWLNHGFLSIKSLKIIFALKKPVVWTFHDMWAFTGGCHYAIECNNYKSACGECPYLRNPGSKDLSHKVWAKKKKILENQKLKIVTSSKWLKECASTSSLLAGKDIRAIPIPIDHNRYMPSDKKKAKAELGLDQQKKHILFGAANVRNILKGFPFFIDALKKLIEISGTYNRYEVLLYGKATAEVISSIPLITHDFAFLEYEEKIICLYNAADVFVIPSLQDNLPNTIIESFACGTPVVGFNSGGIGEMIDHKKNGYLAEYKSSDDLAHGIQWVLENNNYQDMSQHARQKVLNEYSEEAIAARYKQVYEELMKSGSVFG